MPGRSARRPVKNRAGGGGAGARLCEDPEGKRLKPIAAIDAWLAARVCAKIPNDLAGARDKALLLVQFAAALQRSELVALAITDVVRHPDGVKLKIARSKTDQAGKGELVPIPFGKRLKPIAVLDACSRLPA